MFSLFIKYYNPLVQNGAVLNTICTTNIGKYFAAYTMVVNAAIPKKLLKNSVHFNSLGTPVKGFCRLIRITGMASIKLPNVLTKQRSMTSTFLVVVAYFAKD